MAQNNNIQNGLTLYTIDEILQKGLAFVGYKDIRLQSSSDATNFDHFQGHYGCSPYVVAAIFQDLQTTNIGTAKIDSRAISLKEFLMALHHLK